MKKLLSLSAGVLFASFMAAQAIPNGGFENWSNTSWNDLTNYENSNDSYIAEGFGLSGVNAVRSNNWYHGSYSLQLTTLKIGQDTLFAYVTNGKNNPLQGAGGLKTGWTGAQIPTGIRFHYMSTIMAGDTAGAIIVFKKSGSIIGAYMCPITTNAGSYLLFTNMFSPALVMAPDTVIFAALSSVHAIFDNGNNAKGCYPGNMLNIDSVVFTGPVTQPTNFNGDFENWTADTLYQPTGWNAIYPGTFQTTDFHAGSFAAQITTSIPSYGGGSTQTGAISTGSLKYFGVGGYPYTLTTDTLEFYYKYTPAVATTDSGTVSLYFKNGINSTETGMYLKPAASYTLAKLGFTVVGFTPDSVIVSFTSSDQNNPAVSRVGSRLKVDNVMFKSNPLGVLNLAAITGIKIYPNPVTNSFNLNTEGFTGSVQSIDVYDMTGRAILSENYTSGLDNTITSFDMSKTCPGIYIVKVLTSTGVFYQKISKVQ